MKPFKGASQASDWLETNCSGCCLSRLNGGSCFLEQHIENAVETDGEVNEASLALTEPAVGETLGICKLRASLN